MEKNQTKPLPTPDGMAGVVADVVEREGYGFRVDVGANVRVLRALVRWLPAWARLPLVSMIFEAPVKARARAALETVSPPG